MNQFQPIKQKGFTIVELLIVIVVIAVLAAITIVAYNGIQNRAKASAAQSAAAQATKKIMTYAIQNNDQYPVDLATAGVTEGGGTSFQYSYNNTLKTYCVTATSNSTSYYKNNTTQTDPIAGACPGHAVNGGVAITNLVVNPSAETDVNYWSGWAGVSGVATRTRPTNGGWSGAAYQRQAWTTASSTVSGDNGAFALNITPSVQYTASVYGRANKAQRLAAVVYYFSSTDGTGSIIQTDSGTASVVAPNTWTNFTVSSTAPAGANSAAIRVLSTAGTGAVNWAVSDWLDVDAVMFVRGSTVYGYADGNTANWVWNGTTNNSTSTGPAI